ncbi:acetyl-CoA carboxylase biotin carboxylase subunit [Clostridiisalibacter paucivorans]|uniref:acetyl-CoA carboxylase biotin carboxylase subunit n=1 Tax=Clostridiisalibacter paucivorans TaxID=408753 RepID=UPI00047C5447|nr:acetyl-CoA carboxylase biotin carboxylase subunit [Clostridiisalibacter paucivorans]
MLNKILIANRGEIAVRIIRACKEMGIATVAIYSQADMDSLHVHMADESICIGPPSSTKSYLKMENIISAALAKNCDAIHPGYGFLSENPKFAKMCEDNNIVFIGPKGEHISMMGNKSVAREIMMKNGVPVIPGSESSTNDKSKALETAKDIGFPVMIKAASGGGGRGMRIAKDAEEFDKFFAMAKSESLAAFGDDGMYIEKYIEDPRHIEFQILADRYGNVVHLGDRDCSLQRRNQKVIEEAPSLVINHELRRDMGKAAIKAAKAVDYISVGTVEFLLDKNHDFYFIEMNTRIQVEHPVTELVSNIDIVKEQIRIANGEKISYKQKDIKLTGHAIECRINAEDIEKNFRPVPGTIDIFYSPGGMGVRVDTHIYSGYKIPPYYDSMIGKLIVWGNNREEAISRMKRVLDETVIEGVKTNLRFHKIIMSNEYYIKNEINTSFINDKLLEGGGII